MQPTFMGVVHLGPCPASARANGSFDRVLDRALADARALRAGGVDAVMVENFGDAPFHKGTRDDPVTPDVPAALAVAAREIRRETGLPVGVNCLRNDGVAALGAAAVAGACWVRINVLSGTMVTDQGVIDGEAARILGFARQLGGDPPAILADLLVKHAAPLAPVDPLAAARDLAERSGAAGLILTGGRTGDAVDPALVEQVRGVVGEFPVWVGSGLTAAQVGLVRPSCDGFIVGTALKAGGQVTAPVEEARVAAIRRAIDA